MMGGTSEDNSTSAIMDLMLGTTTGDEIINQHDPAPHGSPELTFNHATGQMVMTTTAPPGAGPPAPALAAVVPSGVGGVATTITGDQELQCSTQNHNATATSRGDRTPVTFEELMNVQSDDPLLGGQTASGQGSSGSFAPFNNPVSSNSGAAVDNNSMNAGDMELVTWALQQNVPEVDNRHQQPFVATNIHWNNHINNQGPPQLLMHQMGQHQNQQYLHVATTNSSAPCSTTTSRGAGAGPQLH
ncbi:unnamed protein product, partial [Amoebophrya sp. A120]|eukprot:GSA120T00000720001.1